MTIPDENTGSSAPEAFGRALRVAREARGLSLAQLSAALSARGVAAARSYLSELETGKRPPPGRAWVAAAEEVLGVPGGLAEAADWARTPEGVRELASRWRADSDRLRRHQESLAVKVRRLLAGSGVDEAWRSGALQRLVAGEGASVRPIAGPLPMEVPLINSVAAGYPREFTDLGYPARAADQYVRVPDVDDPDAFAARVVGDSMAPNYLEGDVVVFSQSRTAAVGSDCFARLEPDHETTFKRVYFEQGPGGEELIRLQPINPAYPARTLPREQVAGLYPAVTVVRRIG